MAHVGRKTLIHAFIHVAAGRGHPHAFHPISMLHLFTPRAERRFQKKESDEGREERKEWLWERKGWGTGWRSSKSNDCVSKRLREEKEKLTWEGWSNTPWDEERRLAKHADASVLMKGWGRRYALRTTPTKRWKLTRDHSIPQHLLTFLSCLQNSVSPTEKRHVNLTRTGF